MSQKSKLITCKHCGNEIAVSAKTCPHCGGKNKKPIYTKWWFWVITIVFLIGAIGSCGSKDSSSTKKETPTTVAPQSTSIISTKESTPVTVVKETKPTATVEEIKPTATVEVTKPTATIEVTKPKDNVSIEYMNALIKAETYSEIMHMRSQRLKFIVIRCICLNRAFMIS